MENTNLLFSFCSDIEHTVEWIVNRNIIHSQDLGNLMGQDEKVATLNEEALKNVNEIQRVGFRIIIILVIIAGIIVDTVRQNILIRHVSYSGFSI